MCRVGTDSRVTATASRIAEARLIWPIRRPLLAPHTAGRRKTSKQNGESDSTRKWDTQNIHGSKQETVLTQSVRRETEPTTKPPVHDQPTRSSACGITDSHGEPCGWATSPWLDAKMF